MGGPEPHPPPPDDLADRSLPLCTARGPWYRAYPADRGAIWFGRQGVHRFDAPAGEYGVCYVGDGAACAFLETFGRLTGVRYVSETMLATLHLAEVRSERPLALVDLTGPGLKQLGADNRLATGSYAVGQEWALALWRHHERPDGLVYRSRHDPRLLDTALFDRAESVVTARPLGSFLDEGSRAELARILDTYGFGLGA